MANTAGLFKHEGRIWFVKKWMHVISEHVLELENRQVKDMDYQQKWACNTTSPLLTGSSAKVMCKSDRSRKFPKHFSKQGGDAKWQVSEADGAFLKGYAIRFSSVLIRFCSVRVYHGLILTEYLQSLPRLWFLKDFLFFFLFCKRKWHNETIKEWFSLLSVVIRTWGPTFRLRCFFIPTAGELNSTVAAASHSAW